VNRVLLHEQDRILWLAADTIDWIEAAGNYARVHVGKESHLIREKISTIEERLDADRFVRVHRSAIVNLDRVREVVPVARGEYDLLLSDGVTHVPLSRRYRTRLEFLLGQL
jgi:two-component system LytT family response regulator